MKDVQRAFVKLALQTHPDKPGGSAARFLQIRQAFESIRNSNTGGGGGGGAEWTSAELEEWWQQETGEFLRFEMSHDTRRQVIDAYRTMGPSAGRDKGGYWEMARQLAEREDAMKDGDAGETPPEEERPLGRLEASSSSSPTVHRRRRRR